MEGNQNSSAAISQHSTWLLVMGGLAIAATAASAACAATLYVQYYIPQLPRRRHRHSKRNANTRSISCDGSSPGESDGDSLHSSPRSRRVASPHNSSQVRRRQRAPPMHPCSYAPEPPSATGGGAGIHNTHNSFDDHRLNSGGNIPAVSRLAVLTASHGKGSQHHRGPASDQIHRTKHHAGSVRRNSVACSIVAPGSEKGRSYPTASLVAMSGRQPSAYLGGGTPPDGDGSAPTLPREPNPLWQTDRVASSAALRNNSSGSIAQAGTVPVSGHGLQGTSTSASGHAPSLSHFLSTAPALIGEGQMQEEAALHEQYTRVITPEPALNEETEDVCGLLKECYHLRDKWLFQSSVTFPADEPEAASPSDLLQGHPFEFVSSDPQTQPSEYDFEMRHGVVTVWTDESRTQVVAEPVGTAYEFFSDMHRMLAIQAMGAVRSFCFHRLELLGQKFNLHVMMNADKEFLAQKAAPHRDFYNVRKVDTHIHHSACMHQKHLLRFIKSKLRKEPDQVVIFRDGKFLTLAEVFESLNMTGHDLNVDTLDMHADKNIFHRFDKFNLKYNPCGQSRLREIFIKQDNIIHGRFLAELTQEVLGDLEASKYQHAELRISVYGRKKVEWDILAAWIVQHNLYSDNVVWLIQIPRLYAVYKEQGIIANFEEMLDHLFSPLFEVTRDPTTHPQLHLFLKQVVGFDMVDDESKPERRPNKHMPMPDSWDLKHNPAYSYYAFYTYANLYTLNKFREARGLNTFTFRPHAGEAGDIDHLASAFMLCENIAHGINLRKSPVLQYLFYLKQIGLCMSPLSNNSLFLDYHRNPLPTFFARGLNVSLSTDDPLQIHLTKEPLVEEYSVAAQVWKLSATDLCEIARSSVLHSGFPHQVKMHWVHREYWRIGPEGNDIQKTNVPNLRMRFRADTFLEELSTVMTGAAAHSMRLGARSS